MTTSRAKAAPRQRGFTLLELVAVLIIVGLLAAVSFPRLVNSGTDARAALAQGVAGSLRSAAMAAHYSWALHSGNMGSVTVSLPDGSVAYMWHGYPDAGNCCAAAGIEAMIDVSGLDVVWLDNTRTQLQVHGAPSPSNCSATYTESQADGAMFTVQVVTTGC